jgi:hypothetical protein
MFFEKLKHVSYTVKTKIGIEIWKPYIDSELDHFNNPVIKDCIKIHGSILDYRELLKSHKKDTAMIIDVLEHFDKNVALKLFEDLKQDFNKILLMVPCGYFPQEIDHSGFGADEFQKHRSTWREEDIKELNLTEVVLDPHFHSNPELVSMGMDTGCWFCVWEK